MDNNEVYRIAKSHVLHVLIILQGLMSSLIAVAMILHKLNGDIKKYVVKCLDPLKKQHINSRVFSHEKHVNVNRTYCDLHGWIKRAAHTFISRIVYSTSSI